jgi:hypothetical protein
MASFWSLTIALSQGLRVANRMRYEVPRVITDHGSSAVAHWCGAPRGWYRNRLTAPKKPADHAHPPWVHDVADRTFENWAFRQNECALGWSCTYLGHAGVLVGNLRARHRLLTSNAASRDERAQATTLGAMPLH